MIFAHLCSLNVILAAISGLAPVQLLRRFFRILEKWRWPNSVENERGAAIRLCHPYSHPRLNMRQWNPDYERRDQWHLMPIITPV